MYQVIIKNREYGSWTKQAVITVRGRSLFQSYLSFSVPVAKLLLLQQFTILLSVSGICVQGGCLLRFSVKRALRHPKFHIC